jgi:hypothetical protein
MRRAFLVVVVPVIVTLAGCSKEKPKAETPTTTTSTLPSPLEAAKAIYAGYAAAPTTFARVPHFSRFYVEDNQRKDAACNAGEKLDACTGDRFVCLERAPTKPGVIKDARLDGEQPGTSASVKLTLEFPAPAGVAHVDADVVWEDNAWKIDQVRCTKTAD